MNLLIVRAIYQLCPQPITAKAIPFMSPKAGVLGKQKQVFRFFSGLATNCSATNAYFPARNLSLYEKNDPFETSHTPSTFCQLAGSPTAISYCSFCAAATRR